MGRKNYTGLFYSQPNFWSGLARILDVGGTIDSYDDSHSGIEADWLGGRMPTALHNSR